MNTVTKIKNDSNTGNSLDARALLRRVKKGGWSGGYLAHAYLSCFGMRTFKSTLHNVRYLDDEGKQLFHQIISMFDDDNMDDEQRYDLALEINHILRHET